MATADDRRTRILNYVIPQLGGFTKVGVWEEKARPTTVRGVFSLNYKNWNTTPAEEVRFLDDTLLTPVVDYSVDRLNGTLTIVDKDVGGMSILEGSEFFVTYNFNYFADVDLRSFVDSGLAQINATAEQDTHVNNFTLDTAPDYWDGPLMLYVYMRALQTVLLDTLFWKNYLIFQDGAAMQGIVEAEVNRSQSEWDSQRRSVKRVHLIKKATSAYYAFAVSGIGGFGNNNMNNRLRGWISNRIGINAGG